MVNSVVMNTRDVYERFEELNGIRGDAGSDEVSIAEMALFIEDVFSIRLSDDDICETNLGTLPDARRFVLEKLQLI